jgi:hypothetical protein
VLRDLPPKFRHALYLESEEEADTKHCRLLERLKGCDFETESVTPDETAELKVTNFKFLFSHHKSLDNFFL